MADRPAPLPCPLTGHHFIRLYADVISADLCEQIINRYDANPAIHRDGWVGNNVIARNIKRCREVPLSDHWRDLDNAVFDGVKRLIDNYAKDVPFFGLIKGASNIKDTYYIMQVYSPAGAATFEDGADGFDWHADAIGAITRDRILAVIIYLNDVERGGETQFRSQPVTVKPKSGYALVFPPTFDYEHRGQPPVDTRKIILTTFIVYA